MAQVGIFVKLVAQHGQRAALVAHLQAAVQMTLQQPGTLLWTVHIAPTDDQTVWLYEVYADEAARDAHDRAPESALVRQHIQTLLAAPPDAVLLTPVGGKGLA